MYVQKTRAAATGHVRLTCNTSCPQTDLQSALKMYRSSVSEGQYGAIKDVVPQTSTESFSCAVNGLKDLHSAAVCEYKPNMVYCNLLNEIFDLFVRK